MQRRSRISPASASQIERGELAEWIDGTATEVVTNGQTDDASQEPAGFAWSLYHHNLQLFSLLLIPTLEYIVRSDRLLEKESEKSLKKSLGRLFLWGGSFEDGRLDIVLDESESLRETVLESLVAIGTILLSKIIPKCLIPFIASEGERIKQEMHELSILIEKARIITESDYESDASTGSTDVPDDISAVIDSLGVYVGCLMELLPSMEETLGCLDWQEATDHPSQSIDFQISGPAQPYVLKVYDKFPLADLRLMHRLGEANWQRHLSLRAIGNQQESEVSQDLPKITFVAVSEFHDSGFGSSLPARSSYEATVASHSSFQTTADDKSSGKLCVPPTPKRVSEGEPFNCQICGHFLTTIRNRVDWRRHVFADLKPYLCTFSGCKDEFKTFATRKQWQDHEFGQHRLTRHWACSACQHKSGSVEEWHRHLVNVHKVVSKDPGYPLDSHFFEVLEAAPVESMVCPLCLKIPGKSRRDFATHVGKHMEDIALAALPRDGYSTEDESNASDVLEDTASDGLTGPWEWSNSHFPRKSESENAEDSEGHGNAESSTSQIAAVSVNFKATGRPSDIVREARISEVGKDGAATSTVAEGISPRLSARASNRIHEHILKPLLGKASLEAFHPIVKDCPRRIHGKEIVCLRDLEKTLFFMANEIARSGKSYLEFGLTAIQCIQATVEFLSDSEQIRPQDRPYTSGYFVDLADQIKQYSQQIHASNETSAQEERHESGDEIRLYGGLATTGRPAELVRLKKNGMAISIATGLPVDVNDMNELNVSKGGLRSLSEEAEEDESILQSMARRKKSTLTVDLALKKCREPGCNKEFKRPVDLTKHEKTHSRPWKCPVETCKYHEYGWPTEKELDRHHNDKHNASQRLYECHFKPCPYRSKRESNCKQHMEKAHGWTYVRSKSNGKAKAKTAVPPAQDETTHIDEGFQGYLESFKGYIPEPLVGDDFQLFSHSAYENAASSSDRIIWNHDLKAEDQKWRERRMRDPRLDSGYLSNGVGSEQAMLDWSTEPVGTRTTTSERGYDNNPTHSTDIYGFGNMFSDDTSPAMVESKAHKATASPNLATRGTPPPLNATPLGDKSSTTRPDDSDDLEFITSRPVRKY